MSIGASAGDQFTEINVTPLTDVFLVLLVIMILIAPLIDHSDLKIKPPETKYAKKTEETKGISIDIDKEGQLAINGTFCAQTDAAFITEKLKDILKRGGKTDVPCVVNADGDAKEKIVVAVMQAAKDAGLSKMRVATTQASSY